MIPVSTVLRWWRGSPKRTRRTAGRPIRRTDALTLYRSSSRSRSSVWIPWRRRMRRAAAVSSQPMPATAASAMTTAKLFMSLHGTRFDPARPWRARASSHVEDDGEDRRDRRRGGGPQEGEAGRDILGPGRRGHVVIRLERGLLTREHVRVERPGDARRGGAGDTGRPVGSAPVTDPRNSTRSRTVNATFAIANQSQLHPTIASTIAMTPTRPHPIASGTRRCTAPPSLSRSAGTPATAAPTGAAAAGTPRSTGPAPRCPRPRRCRSSRRG